MKTMRNALNITADNHELVKAGYIQLPVPITITEEWLNSPSLLYKEETNRERLMYDLRACGITDTDFEKLIGKRIQKLRKEKGLTQQQFAEMIDLSVILIIDSAS